jgi:hypothetical protein
MLHVITKANVYKGFLLQVTKSGGERNSSIGTTRVDLDALTGSLKASGKIINNNEIVNISGELAAIIRGPTVHTEYKSKKFCINESCYNVTATPSNCVNSR